MRRRWAVVVARAVRAVRGLWPDGNPLRRRLDRVEAAIVGGLAGVFLAGVPLAVLAAAHLAYATGQRDARVERAWRHVPAVLLADAPALVYAIYGVTVPARWAAPDGGPGLGWFRRCRGPGLAAR